jgi:dihydroneopterin aldolase
VDKIFLRDLEVETVIGIWEWERRIKQLVRIDLEVATDVRRAAASDSIEAALDYKEIAKRLIGYVAESRFNLVETLAERLAELVIKEFAVTWLKLSISKPGAIKGSRVVGVQIERTHDDYA